MWYHEENLRKPHTLQICLIYCKTVPVVVSDNPTAPKVTAICPTARPALGIYSSHPSSTPHLPPLVGTARWNRCQEHFTPAVPNTTKPFQVKRISVLFTEEAQEWFLWSAAAGREVNVESWLRRSSWWGPVNPFPRAQQALSLGSGLH